jgi:hypothetical protein
MYPKPTQLFRGEGVTDDPASESYWKAAKGIRMSGMPAFKIKLNNTQLWQVSQLVAQANEIPESVNGVLVPDHWSTSTSALTSSSGHESATKYCGASTPLVTSASEQRLS